MSKIQAEDSNYKIESKQIIIDTIYIYYDKIVNIVKTFEQNRKLN